MSIEENKAIARRFSRAWATDDLTTLDELAAPNFTASYAYFYSTHQKDSVQDLEEFKQAILAFQDEMTDLTLVSEDDIIADDDKVVIRWTASGTYARDDFGFTDGSIVGKSVVWTGMTLYRIVDGKVVEEIGHEDYWAHPRQLGITPSGWKRRASTV